MKRPLPFFSCSTSSTSQSRGGFSLIELLTSIGVISLLLALILPAVQRVRESARAIECRNNLRNLGLSFLEFHDAYQYFPRNTVRPRGTTQIDTEPQGNLWNWHAGTFESWPRQILPFVKQSQARVQDAVRILGCPSDPRGPMYRIPTYGFTWYVGAYSNTGTVNNGVIVDDSDLKSAFTVSINDISDGTSNTILLGERPPPEDGQWGWWDSRCCIEDTISPTRATKKIYSNGLRGKCPIPAVYGPGSISDDCSFHSFWSHHAAGANFCMADGSVRMINYQAGNQPNAPWSLMESLASRNQQEKVPGEL